LPQIEEFVRDLRQDTQAIAEQRVLIDMAIVPRKSCCATNAEEPHKGEISPSEATEV
jgi:hypothetical protein